MKRVIKGMMAMLTFLLLGSLLYLVIPKSNTKADKSLTLNWGMLIVMFSMTAVVLVTVVYYGLGHLFYCIKINVLGDGKLSHIFL